MRLESASARPCGRILKLTTYSLHPTAPHSPLHSFRAYADYNEIVLLYGYVVLFAAAFPLAPLIAFMMNVIEVHVDAYKLTVYGRPKPLYAADIGMWAYFLGVMSTASVITNMGLIIYSSPFFADWSDWQKLLLFVIVENTMLVLKRTVEVRPFTCH